MFGSSAGSEFRVESLHNTSLNLVEYGSAIIAKPVEILLRWQYGTRYYPLPVTFFSAMLMIFVPGIALLFSSVTRMIPFVNIPVPLGMFGLDSFAELHFLVLTAHSIRLWRRMFHPEKEPHSEFEGPALPFFQLLPKGLSFYFVRIVWEPLSVLVASIVLQDLHIIQTPLAYYLRLAALSLVMKSFIAWYREWEFLRISLDVQVTAPTLARFLNNEATDQELAQLHLAKLPKDIDPQVRQAAVERIARAYSPENRNR